jgi:hypothetical protein
VKKFLLLKAEKRSFHHNRRCLNAILKLKCVQTIIAQVTMKTRTDSEPTPGISNFSTEKFLLWANFAVANCGFVILVSSGYANPISSIYRKFASVVVTRYTCSGYGKSFLLLKQKSGRLITAAAIPTYLVIVIGFSLLPMIAQVTVKDRTDLGTARNSQQQTLVFLSSIPTRNVQDVSGS